LTHQEAKSFYDRFGKMQDLQRIYEDPAIEVLLRRGGFAAASAIVELGCGTGRLAERLLQCELSGDATYAGFDVSETMIALARDRIAPWSDRATAQLTDGTPRLPVDDGTCDRFLSTYVLDLLSEMEIEATLREARRVLRPGGRLCLASLTFGRAWPSRLLGHLWQRIHSLSPRLLGGCRPLDLHSYVGPGWTIEHREVVCTFGLCTEVVIASAIG
jgi:ubiquinone/menaquinone biosynthesis C-methylase UbiE